MPRSTKSKTESSKLLKHDTASVSKAATRVPSQVSPPLKLYNSFLPIPLVLPTPIPIPVSKGKTTLQITHYLYIRPHRPKPIVQQDVEGGTGSLGENRTIFAVNLPVDMTERDLRVVFSRWGVIESIDVGSADTGGDELEDAVRGLPLDSDDEERESNSEEIGGPQPVATSPEGQFTGTSQPTIPRSKRPRRRPPLPSSVPESVPLPSLDPRQTPYGPSGARSAHITFLDPISVSRAMNHPGTSLIIPKYGDDPSNPIGLDYYTRLHTSLRPSLASVKLHADSAMARHDHLHSLLLSSRAKKQGAGALVDEDGFTVVVRGGRFGRTGGTGALGVSVARKADERVGKKKKKAVGARELVDFYRFQKVDRKRQELAGLRSKFEQDKQKVEEMKHAKRYKPY